MTSILLIISFLLHLILVVVLYYLYQQIQELKAERSRETEVLLSRFLDEIKQENRQLQHQLQHQSNTHQPKKATTASVKKPSVQYEKKVPEEASNNVADTTPIMPPVPTERADKVETSSESRIFQLYNKGHSPEEIAKKMNRGKTEVELLIKLYKKEY